MSKEFRHFNPSEWYRKADTFGEFCKVGYHEIRVDSNIYDKAIEGDKQAREFIESLLNPSQDVIMKTIDLPSNEVQSDGVKYDNGKPLVGTMLDVFPNALMYIGALIQFGTTKYPSPTNWKNVKDGQKRYKDALMRHLLKHCLGEKIDPETKLPHLTSVCWNALAILELYLMEKNNETNNK